MHKLIILVFLGLPVFSFSDVIGYKKIYVEDKKLYFNDEITEKNALEFSRVLVSNGGSIDKIIVNSYGGSVDHAIDMANLIYEHKLDVEIDKYCGSSCANYIFPAGKRKFINRNSVIFWHGGANMYGNKKNDGLNHDEKTALDVKALHKKEIDFYRMIGVDPILPYRGQYFGDSYTSLKFSEGWFYSVSDMKKMGIRNVILKNKAWNPAPNLVNLKSLIRIPLNGKINENELIPGDSIIYGLFTKEFSMQIIEATKKYNYQSVIDKSYIKTAEIFYDDVEGVVYNKHLISGYSFDNRFLKNDIVEKCKAGFKGGYYVDFFIFSNTDAIYTTHVFFKNGKEKYRLKLYRKECIEKSV
ncbi:MAG: hypothetical protein IPK77_14590 [Cellvibrio sp.]|nr:hypothetical protein [Cellvibrio sp.]